MNDTEDSRIQFEREKFDKELKLKERDLLIRESELDLKKQSEEKGARWSASPIITTVLVTVFGIVGTGVGLIAQGVLNIRLERQKHEQNLILKVIETGDSEKAQKNLLFLVRAGLITDEEGRIEKLAADSKTAPVLPKPIGSSLFESGTVSGPTDSSPSQETIQPIASSAIEKAVEVAAREVGVTEQPPGSNRGPKIDEYIRSVGFDPVMNVSWTQAFVYWCFKQASEETRTKNPLPKTGRVFDFVTWANKNKLQTLSQEKALKSPPLIRPGMVFVIFRNESTFAGHTGIVESVEGTDLVVIEGNSSDAVIRRKRPITDFTGFVDLSKTK